ncbi:hypothetical protein K470DRAFT_213199 [Piedraia hortae CBS 480.64]|uniref:Protein SQS1 n=1 Tax=Piedraia hortae CBS 480.64 TaxID=1314780 RepID=A0A6A7C4H7_9PEZI|nr:hypothetical protein K470DRAFT_213199 [Piedraia hortae CBS 480.64]
MRKELRVFMADEGRESVSFPPMNTAERKVLHNLAGKLGCKSKSMGKGKQRFTIVSKTEKSKHHGQEEVEVDYWGRGGKKHRGRSKHEASVRHGEVVGAGAPELSSESLGHKLMEKMGWVKGTALGKEGSGGRLLPVEQIMRSGKTGLGG